MDKMCNKFELKDVKKTGASVSEGLVNLKRCGSPVFKCGNYNKPICGGRSDSSESYDYQFSQTIKSRTSSKCGSESNDSVLPFTPVFSPIPVCSVQFQPPLLHSLGTVAKKTNVEKPRNSTKEVKTCGVFDSLGMTDKDISWVSSMASPPPPQAPGTGFNTIEKATFFPEEKFQNIQPRALFSPPLDEDFGCKPLPFSSESEDDESYQTNIRLSDVCATLRLLEVKSIDQKTPEKKVPSVSPVMKTKKRKESSKKKPKEILVISPEPNDQYDFSVDNNLKDEKVPSDSNFIEDDSFQSISFTCIDELCKTLVNTTDPSTAPESDNTVVAVSDFKLRDSGSKYFYTSKTKSDIYAVSSVENLHFYVQALEEGDVDVPQGKKIEKKLMEEGIVRFDALEKDSNATKRLHSEVMDGGEEENTEKKLKMNDETSSWDAMKQYLTESQLNVSDTEIFRTVENLEKTLASQGSKDEGSQHLEIPDDENNYSKGKDLLRVTSNMENKPSTSKNCFSSDSLSELGKAAFVGFTTASGSKVSVSEKALMKAQEVLKSCDEIVDVSEVNSMEGFSTGAGKTIQVSNEALEKAKALMSKCEESSTRSSRTGLSKTIKVSPEALEKAKALWSGEDITERNFVGCCSSTLRVSPEALEKAKALMFGESSKKTETSRMKGFSTGSGKTIQVSEKALEKAKNILLECSESSGSSSKIVSKDVVKNIKVSPEALEKGKALMFDESSNKTGASCMKGFSTESGKTIKISEKALEKAKSMLLECSEQATEDVKKISPEFIKTIKVSPEALEKAKDLMLGESSNKTGASWMKGFSTGSGKTIQVSEKALEKAKSILLECSESSGSSSKIVSKEVVKNIQVSPEALEKGKALMFGESSNESGSKLMKGFSTGSGKTIQVSEKALEKAKSMLLECSESSESNPKLFRPQIGKNIQVSPEALEKAKGFMFGESSNEARCSWMKGFSTGSGKTIQISEKALEKAKSILLDCSEQAAEDVKVFQELDKNIKVSPEALEKAKDLMFAESSNEARSSWIKGFSTGSGKTIQVSEKALEKAKSILLECSKQAAEDIRKISPELDKNIKVSPEALEKAQNLMFGESSNEAGSRLMKGFSTGSGKTIQVSEKSLEKAKSIFSECNKSSGSNSKIVSKELGKNIQISPEALEKGKDLMFGESSNEAGSRLMKGFSTGSGKTIQVSEKALEKAKSILSECSEQAAEDVKKISPELEVSSKASEKRKAFMFDETLNEAGWKLMKGFSTGSGKTIQVSEKALEKAKSILSECNEQAAEDVKKISRGSSKKIQVSNEALEKATTLMADCDLIPKIRQPFRGLWRSLTPGSKPESGVKLSGFLKGLGEQVNVSKEALEKVKAESAKGSISLGNVGFSTATGSKVSISETALSKAKELAERWNRGEEEARESFEVSKDSKSEVEKPRAKIKASDPSWDEIVPSWLHVYTTSPSLACDRTDLSPVASHEDGKSSCKPDTAYVIKSPVLGKSDRFYKKIKRRKLQFQDDAPEVPRPKTTGFVVPYKSTYKKPGVKRTSTNLSMDSSVPCKKAKSEVREKQNLDVEEERAKARAQQEKVAKEKEKTKPLRGSHLSKKGSEKQVKWMEAVGGASPEVYSEEVLKSLGVKEGVIRVNVTNALRFEFLGTEYFGPSCVRNTTGFFVGDGCLLIPDQDNNFGVEVFKRGFAASPGVQPNLLPEGWFENHYKWIVWKLAHYERSFPRYFAGVGLTPHNLLLQLKYRYDREIDGSERSALKKILERDDTSVKRMVLCVCGIKKTRKECSSDYELTLTDGWYSCPARTDPAMTRLIEERKFSVGTKLVTQGAVLVNCDQGISPLEMNEGVYLKISTNSTRRVRWDTKLGFQRNPESFTVSLGSVLPQGGPISRLDVIIVRVYPVLYMEKTSDGHHVTRNLRSEEKAEAEYRKIQEKRMETICSEIQAEMQKQRRRRSEKTFSKKNLLEVEQVEDLCQLMENSSDPSALEELMTASQKKRVENFHFEESDRLAREISVKVEEKLRKEKLNKRNVSEFLRAKVVDLRKPDYNNPAVLSVWNPNEEVLRLFSEGKVVSITNASLPNSSRLFKPMQINTNRQSQYREVNRSIKYPARQVTRLKDVSSKISPVFEEVDVVGMIALIQDACYGSRFSQTVYLTDFEFNFVGIVFWGSCKDYGWENVLGVRSIVACSNLQWKKSYASQEVPSLNVNENSVFTENPKRPHLKEEVERLRKQMPEDLNTFVSKCEEELTSRLEDSKWRANASANDSSRRVNGFESRPAASSTPIRPFSASLSSGEAEPSPIQKRIEKLQSYGEPPPLLPLLVTCNARKFKRKS